VAASTSMKEVVDHMRRAARTDATVLIVGERGTGKEIVARAIQASSERRGQRFVPIACGAIPAHQLEGELHAAFAEAGTVFLDDIGQLPLDAQVKLDRMWHSAEATPSVRVIATNQVDLKALVGAARFRDDLYYRLNVVPIRVPALRDRREDIAALAALFLERPRSQPHSEGACRSMRSPRSSNMTGRATCESWRMLSNGPSS
jgi:two-component system response regulator AtoC